MSAIKQIRYSSRFIRALKALAPELAPFVAEREAIFKTNCFDPRLKTLKLKGRLRGFWSFYLTHSHRVLFEFITHDTVGFINVGDHDIYK